MTTETDWHRWVYHSLSCLHDCEWCDCPCHEDEKDETE